MKQNEQDRLDESVGEDVGVAAEDVAAGMGDRAAEQRLAKDEADESAGEAEYLEKKDN